MTAPLTVQELIDLLSKVEDKTRDVAVESHCCMSDVGGVGDDGSLVVIQPTQYVDDDEDD